ncbi:hypothetical protein [Streptomyces triticisoli]|jgi:hypothetical protein|uniref:hypothetical protein n=1 Tax=Streptomyces triticisoli TaxID=2182797 RepID=UPI0013009E59|nr:hypothetical protein [Streptomyces triticisoli]
MVVGEPAGAVFGAGFGEPGADLDGVSVDADGLAGCGGAAFAVEKELQELDGLGEGAPSTAGGAS